MPEKTILQSHATERKYFILQQELSPRQIFLIVTKEINGDVMSLSLGSQNSVGAQMSLTWPGLGVGDRVRTSSCPSHEQGLWLVPAVEHQLISQKEPLSDLH